MTDRQTKATVSSRPTQPGLYAEYQQAESQTGLPGSSLCYVGPYATKAEAIADGQDDTTPGFVAWVRVR